MHNDFKHNLLLTRELAREFDRTTIHEFGLPGVVLMENAGQIL